MCTHAHIHTHMHTCTCTDTCTQGISHDLASYVHTKGHSANALLQYTLICSNVCAGLHHLCLPGQPQEPRHGFPPHLQGHPKHALPGSRPGHGHPHGRRKEPPQGDHLGRPFASGQGHVRGPPELLHQWRWYQRR